MIVTIQPSDIKGILWAPASKSSMQRACAAALLHKGETVIHNPGMSNDDKAAINIIQKLGAEVRQVEDVLSIISKGVQPVSSEIDCGESGLSIRMFTSLAALSDKTITINGSGSLVSRPMDFFNEIFPRLGVTVSSNNGKLPLQIKGPLRPENITIDGSLSSQFLTGLLLAYAAADAKDVSIKVNDLKSRPYIDLTLDVMKQFGLKVPVNDNYSTFYFSAAAHPARANAYTHTLADSSLLTTRTSADTAFHYTVEGDWSGAAFLLVAGAIAGPVTVKGLDVFSTQADKAILQALMAAEARLSIQPEQIEIKPLPLKAFHFNATECPDLFPPLVALAAYCKGTSVIEGTHRLTHKESDRALTLQEVFGKMGVAIELQDDLMIVHGGSCVKGAAVSSHHDHRIAMACAVAGLKAEGPVTIDAAEAIDKSYPDFYEHLQALGASLVISK